jgi:hypothetical protein
VLPRTGSAACKIDPAPVGLSAVMGKKSDTRHGEASATLAPTTRINHVGERLDVGAFRESLERIQTEIGFCLKGLAMVEGGGMGRALSPNSRARAVSAMGFKVTRPKSKVVAISKSARASKGKGPLVYSADWPKVFMAKEGPGFRPPSESSGLGASLSRVDPLPGLVDGIFTPGASSLRPTPSLVLAVGNPSSDGQTRAPVMDSLSPVPLGLGVSAARVDIPQSPAASVPTSSTSGLVAGLQRGQPNFPVRIVSPRGSTELTVVSEPVQVSEVPGQRKEGVWNVGSGSDLEKRSLEQSKPDSREPSVVSSEAGPGRLKDYSEQLQLRNVIMCHRCCQVLSYGINRWWILWLFRALTVLEGRDVIGRGGQFRS